MGRSRCLVGLSPQIDRKLDDVHEVGSCYVYHQRRGSNRSLTEQKHSSTKHWGQIRNTVRLHRHGLCRGPKRWVGLC